MIEFKCAHCGRALSVSDDLAGRRAKCKICGEIMTIPLQPRTQSTTAPPAPKFSMRTRRLTADAQQMQRAFEKFPLIRVLSAVGDPPDLYQIEYSINGLQRSKGGKPVPQETHRVEIQLTADYPRLSPKCRMLTPVFHPNIDTSSICVGDHWTAGERLVDLVIRIGEMISYQAYNIKSPLDGEAAMWADLNVEKLPIDHRDLRPPERD
jgi:ubiquitin-protein ligase